MIVLLYDILGHFACGATTPAKAPTVRMIVLLYDILGPQLDER